jgi:hypothetical protein
MATPQVNSINASITSTTNIRLASFFPPELLPTNLLIIALPCVKTRYSFTHQICSLRSSSPVSAETQDVT